tara:strand:+ start:143 stop:1030 length:888 start_codon:yes stop_codon:yes gene_type:complete
MAEDDAPTPIAGDEKPFFAIDAEDLTEAQSSDSAVTPPPPQPMMIGALGDTGGQPASGGQAWGVPTSQLTGDITAFSGQQMFAIPPIQKKKGFEWGQFLLGLFVPFVVFGILAVIVGVSESNYEDPWRLETIRAESDDGISYSLEISPMPNERVEYAWSEFEYDGYSYSINFWTTYGATTSTIYQTNQSGDWREEAIGTFYQENQTMAFELDNASAEFLMIDLEFLNTEIADGNQNELLEMGFCLLPIGWLVATIASFVKGKRSLGWGLLTSAFVGVFLLPLLAFLLLVLALGAM